MTENPKEEREDEEDCKIPDGKKICPFMNGFRRGILCTPDCALYREGKKDHECVFHELQSTSWFLKQANDAREKSSE